MQIMSRSQVNDDDYYSNRFIYHILVYICSIYIEYMLYIKGDPNQSVIFKDLNVKTCLESICIWYIDTTITQDLNVTFLVKLFVWLSTFLKKNTFLWITLYHHTILSISRKKTEVKMWLFEARVHYCVSFFPWFCTWKEQKNGRLV